MRGISMRAGSVSRRVFVVVIALLAASCSGAGTGEGAVPVSMVQLITDPGGVAGRTVEVTGYLQKNPTLRLFLSRDHGIARDIQSSVIVSDDTSDGSLTQSGCLDKYVKITGTLDRFMGAAWAIVRVQDVMQVDTVETCWSRSASPGDAGVSH